MIELPWLGVIFNNTDKFLLEYEQLPKQIIEGYYIGYVFKIVVLINLVLK